MKKLVLFAAVALSMSVFSCGNGENAGANDSDSLANDTIQQLDTTAKADTDTVAKL